MINSGKILAIAFAALSACSCSGTLYTYKDPAKACVMKNDSCTEVYEGVFYKPLVETKKYYFRDRILNSKGEVTHYRNGTDGKGCNPVAIEETVLAPSKDDEYLLRYDSAFFETAKFSMERFQNGTLKSAGSESTPGGKSMAEALEKLALTVKTLNHGSDVSASLTDPTIRNAVSLFVDLHDYDLPDCSHGELPFPIGMY